MPQPQLFFDADNQHRKRPLQVSNRFLPIFLTSLVLASGMGCGRSAAFADDLKKDKTSMVLEKHFIRDPGSRNMKSHSLLVPKGWKLTGQTRWADRRFFRMLPSNDITICSPQGVEARVYRTFCYSDPRPSSAIQQLYGIRRPAEGSSDGGYPVRQFPKNASEWKKEIKNKLMREKRPDATNLRFKNVTDFPELTKVLEKLNGPTIEILNFQNRQAQRMGLNSRVSMSIRTYVFELEYRENGTQFEEILLFGVVESTNHMQDMTQINWNVCPKISYRAPKGQLEKNMPLLMTLTTSIQPTKEWTNMLFQHIATMNKIDRDAFDKRMKMQRETWADINRIRRESDRRSAAITDETHLKVINCIRGTSDYSFDGEEYQLPAGYDHVYTNGFDSIILTNDALFNPNVDLQGSQQWSAMKQVR